jgi:hypothetical protein
VLTFIEKSITSNLLPHGSVGKFIFMDSRGKWFICQLNNHKISMKYLQHGPWNHFDEVFRSPNYIYESRDILYPGSNNKYKSVITKFSKEIFGMTEDSEFTQNDYTGNKYIWNLHAIPFVLTDDKIVKEDIRKNFKEENCTIFTNADECVVRKGLYLSVTQSKNTKEKADQTQEKPATKKGLISSK